MQIALAMNPIALGMENVWNARPITKNILNAAALHAGNRGLRYLNSKIIPYYNKKRRRRIQKSN